MDCVLVCEAISANTEGCGNIVCDSSGTDEVARLCLVFICDDRISVV